MMALVLKLGFKFTLFLFPRACWNCLIPVCGGNRCRESSKEVAKMKFDIKLVTGIFVGMLLGLHYSSVLIPYIPLLMVPTVILLLKNIR